ncbi:N/A [soil metagenome]
MKNILFVLGLLVGVSSLVSAQDAVLRVGDQIEVRLAGVPSEDSQQVTGSYPIDGQGFVNMPHIGTVRAAGLTQGALQKSIETSYRSRQIYTNPTITVTVPATARFVNVGGEVKTPRRVEFTPDLTVEGAIIAAGGYTEYADPKKVRLSRDGKTMPLNLKQVDKNYSRKPVQPGDSIEVPRGLW